LKLAKSAMMQLAGIPKRAVLLLLALLLFLLHVGEIQAGTSDEELKKGAEKLVELIESKNPPALLDLFSEQGTSFISGTYALPKAEYSPAEIRKDFETKTGVYCVFFDTACLREADSKERARQRARPIQIPLNSVFDLVAAAKVKKFATFDVSSMNGMVALMLTNVSPQAPEARTGKDAVVFYFRSEHGQMKLRNIEFQ
jgi:hypothetical protein